MEIFIGSTPNSTKRDVAVAKRLVEDKTYSDDSIVELRKRFEDIFGSKKVFFFNRGRDSLYFFLKLLKLKNIDEVILQGFTCVSVVAPILWSNANPVYAEISSQDFCIDITKLKERITENTRVVIVQHTFGNIANIKEIASIIEEFNLQRDEQSHIYIVEDCAHMFLNSYENTDIGKYSDALFFSFAQDKAISCTQGSALVINNESLKGRAMTEYRKIPEQKFSDVLYNAKYILHWERIKSDYFRKIFPFFNITFGKVEILLFRFLGLIRKQASIESLKFDGISKLSNLQAKLLLEQLDQLEEFNNHRKKITRIYCDNLERRFRFYPRSNYSLLRYPILVKNPNVVRDALRQEGVITGRWYSTAVFPMEPSHYHLLKFVPERYPNVIKCCKYVLNLPTYIGVSEEDALRICDIVNRFAIAI